MEADDKPPEQDMKEGEWIPHLPTGKLRRAHLSRGDVVTAFQTAFEMIGGVPRLALWADHNPEEFFKLYARLLPNSAYAGLDGDREFIVRHILPPTALDRPHANEQDNPTYDPMTAEKAEQKRG